MSVVEQLVYSRLTESTSVTSKVSTRIYPTILPQEPKLPALTYDLISNARESTMPDDTGTAHARMQISAYARTYSEASAAIEGVRSAVQRWSWSTLNGNIASAARVDAQDETDKDEFGQGFTVGPGSAYVYSINPYINTRNIPITMRIYQRFNGLPVGGPQYTLGPESNNGASYLPFSFSTAANTAETLSPGEYTFMLGATAGQLNWTVYVDSNVPTYVGGSYTYLQSSTAGGAYVVPDANQDLRFSVTGETVHDVYLENESSTYDSETRTYVHTLDAIIHYEEG